MANSIEVCLWFDSNSVFDQFCEHILLGHLRRCFTDSAFLESCLSIIVVLGI